MPVEGTALAVQGQDVTCLARGESGVVPPGVRFVRSDRRAPGAYDLVSGDAWHDIIELGYDADLITGALEAVM